MTEVRVSKKVRSEMVYTLPNPTNMAELGKAYTSALKRWRAHYGDDIRVMDDTFILESDGEETECAR